AAFYRPVTVDGTPMWLELAQAARAEQQRKAPEARLAFSVRLAQDATARYKTEGVRVWRLPEEPTPAYELLAYPEYWAYQPVNVNAVWTFDTRTAAEATFVRSLSNKVQPTVIAYPPKAGNEK